MLILDLDQHRIARRDVGDGGGEHIGALLIEQAGTLTRGLGLLVESLRLRLFLNLAFDHALVIDQPHTIDRAVFRQGKHVDTFDPGIARVGEALLNPHAGDRAGHIDKHIGLQLWGEPELFAFGTIEPQPL